MTKQVNIDTPIQFLSDFKAYHDQRVTFCRMYSNIWIREFDKQVSIAETFLKKAVDSCDFCMCMRPESFEQALKDNEIKEMFEIGHGATVGGIRTRRKALKQLYDLNSEQYPIKEMPKYGLLVGKQKYHDLIQDPDVFYHYGIIMLTFKKERLLHRTTMTVGSSLQFDESLLKTPTFVTDPKFICIKGVPKDPMSSDGFFLGVSYFVNHLINLNKLSPDMPNRMADLADGISGFENFELQYFGKITISDDVKEVCYMPLGGEEEEQIERLKPLLAQYGLECKRFGEETFSPTSKNSSTKSPRRKKQVESKEKQAETKEKQTKSRKKQTEPKEKQTESKEKQIESKEKQIESKEKQTKSRKKLAESKEKQTKSKEKQTKSRKTNKKLDK